MCSDGMFGLLEDIFCVSILFMLFCVSADFITYQEKLEVVKFCSFFFLGPCFVFGIQLPMYVNSDNVNEMNKKRERKIDLYVFS